MAASFSLHDLGAVPNGWRFEGYMQYAWILMRTTDLLQA